jgi:hypothetical protein
MTSARQALGARGADVVAFQHLQHGAAGMPHQDRGDRVAEHEGRHDGGGEAGAPVLEGHVARRRQPAEFDREQEDQHDAEPEIRRRDAPQREHVGAVVPGRALLHRRDDAGGNADQERDHDRHRGELDRHRQLLRDQLEHRHLDAQRLAEVARQHALDPVDVLHRDRLIEPVLRRICAITSGSRSSPAITSAGSPGSNCCSEKISIDTKNSVGISCRRRLARKFSMGHAFSRRGDDGGFARSAPGWGTGAEAKNPTPARSRSPTRGEGGALSASLQLQPDHAHQPVRHLLVAFELGGVRDQHLAVIEIEIGSSSSTSLASFS